MSVRYHPLYAAAMIAIGAFTLLSGTSTGFLDIMDGGLFVALAGGLIGVLGFLMLSRPSFVVTPVELHVKNLLGMTMQSYPHHLYADLQIDGRSLSVLRPGQPAKKIADRWVRHPGDWAGLTRLLAQPSVF